MHRIRRILRVAVLGAVLSLSLTACPGEEPFPPQQPVEDGTPAPPQPGETPFDPDEDLIEPGDGEETSAFDPRV